MTSTGLSEDEKVQRIFKLYLTETNIKEDIADKIIKLAENYQERNKEKQFLAKFSYILKKSYDEKNFKQFNTIIKRFLFIVNKLLEKEARSVNQNEKKYTEIIS